MRRQLRGWAWGCVSGLRSSSVGERGRKEEGGEGEAGRPLRLKHTSALNFAVGAETTRTSPGTSRNSPPPRSNGEAPSSRGQGLHSVTVENHAWGGHL
ncbi:hypothetical protein DFH09DRAFT_1334828 [Mycena vulgaris]|nr:hypothetical protein DFH09DRAFT_1334828 [Mycena vulgaris]